MLKRHGKKDQKKLKAGEAVFGTFIRNTDPALIELYAVVQAAIDRIIEAVKPSPAAPGILVQDAAGAHEWREHGMRFILTTLEAIMIPAVRDYLNTVRA